jgi:hypothetical protein
MAPMVRVVLDDPPVGEKGTGDICIYALINVREGLYSWRRVCGTSRGVNLISNNRYEAKS